MKHCTSSVVKRYIISSGEKIESKCFYNCKLSKRMLIMPLKQSWSHLGRHASKFFYTHYYNIYNACHLWKIQSERKQNTRNLKRDVWKNLFYVIWFCQNADCTNKQDFNSRHHRLWDLEALWPMDEGEYTDRDKSFLNVELSQKQGAKVNLKQELRKKVLFNQLSPLRVMDMF